MGSDIAVEAADIALMSDDISKIPYLMINGLQKPQDNTEKSHRVRNARRRAEMRRSRLSHNRRPLPNTKDKGISQTGIELFTVVSF